MMKLYGIILALLILGTSLALGMKLTGNDIAMVDVDDLAREILVVFGSDLDQCETDSCPSLLLDITGNSFMKTLLCISACQQARVMNNNGE